MNKLIAIFAMCLFSACAISSEIAYTLYRTGIDMPTQRHDEALRVHIATFDARPLKSNDENAKYNLSNCQLAQELFSASQPHFRNFRSNNVATGSIKIRYWCEKGRVEK